MAPDEALPLGPGPGPGRAGPRQVGCPQLRGGTRDGRSLAD